MLTDSQRQIKGFSNEQSEEMFFQFPTEDAILEFIEAEQELEQEQEQEQEQNNKYLN